MKMKMIEKMVKDKALFYWLDLEISLVHIATYWIFALLIDVSHVYWIAGLLTLWTFVYMGRVGNKLRDLLEQDNEQI